MLNSFSRLQEEYHGIETNFMKILTYDLKQGLQDNYKSYAYNRICTIVDGSKEVTINNETNITYSKDEFILLPPNSTVDMFIKEDTKAVVFEISDRIINKIHSHVEETVQQDIKLKEDLFYSDLTAEIKQPIQKISKVIKSQVKDNRFLLDLYAQELVYNLIYQKHLFASKQTTKNEANIAAEIIKQEGNEDISIYEIANILRMSNANLTYLFKQQFGMTPKQYQNTIRLTRSKDLLIKYNVTEAAMRLGFTNISYFIRMFKNHYGVTPKQYKMKLNV